MADISVTATAVLTTDAAAEIEDGTLGATVTAGQALYKDTSDRRWKLADANGASELIRKATGIALNGGASGQPVDVLKKGDLTLNAVLTAGVGYYLSDTPGGICPYADIGAGEYVCQIGLAKSTTVLAVDFKYPGVSL